MPAKRNATLGLVLAFLSASSALMGCSRNPIEAINLANEGDKAKGVNPDEAISKYEQAVQLDPSNHRIINKLVLAYKKKEDWAKMASAAAKAEKAAPTYATYSYLRGYALARAAEKGPTGWSEAKEPLQDAIKKDPNLADAYFDLAEVLLHLDDEQGALQNYTKAIDAKPDELSFYGPLADLYIRLGYIDQAEQVAKDALNVAKPGDKALFAIHSLVGDIYDRKGNSAGAIAEYEAAKQACGQCTETARGEQMAYFNLGAAYALANPPRKNEAIQQLTAFSKVVCKGGLATRYSDQCAQAQELARKLGGALP
jgi:tetratricopeptide (TPR) repeat protein